MMAGNLNQSVVSCHITPPLQLRKFPLYMNCMENAIPTSKRIFLPNSQRNWRLTQPCRDYTQRKMRGSGLVFAVSAVSFLVYLVTRPLTAGDWPVIFKVLSILLLAVLGFRTRALLGAALALSSLGDVFL